MRILFVIIAIVCQTQSIFAQQKMRPDQYDLSLMMEKLSITMPTVAKEQDDINRPVPTEPMKQYFKQEEYDAGQRIKVWTPSTGYQPADAPRWILPAMSTQLMVRSNWGLWQNYRLDKAYTQDYTPLQLPSTRQQWEEQKAELSRLCHEEVWGVVPECASSIKITWSVNKEADNTYLLTGKVSTERHPALAHQPMVRARIFMPDGKKDVPAVVHLSGLNKPDSIFLHECLQHGWAYIQYEHTAVQPDNGEFLTDYLVGLCNKGMRRSPTDWGALGAWGWGVSRIIDFFSSNANGAEASLVNAKKICVAGHSRCGKAAMVAMVNEPRLAAAYISCSGCGGTAPLRRHYGEDIEQVATYAEYHWMAGNVLKYCGPVNEGEYLPRRSSLLPVDSHVMLALCAPRPVFVCGGTTDLWADPVGMYLTCQRASSVYEALCGEGFVSHAKGEPADLTDLIPVPDKSYTLGPLAYRMHTGGHVDNADFPYVCQWLKEKVFK